MKHLKRITFGLLGFALLPLANSSRADVLTFDNLSGYNIPVPSTYEGFNFSEWQIDSTCSGSSSTGACTTYPYQPESLPTSIFTNDTNNNSISSVGGTPFVFTGAYFTGYSGVTDQFDLYLAGKLVATSSTLTLSGTETPAFLSSGYSGKVDTVVVISNRPDYFVMDNFTYTPAVPEPSTVLMIGVGLAGLFGLRLRKGLGLLTAEA
jgi:hypothetical protein